MDVQRPFRVSRMIFFLVVAFASSGCSDMAEMVRKLTYPPDFNYVSDEEFRSSMNRLAYQVQLLDMTLSGDDIQQGQVKELLRNIEKTGSGLQAGDAGSNHPAMEVFIDGFMNNVERARNAVNMDPPNYYLAGRVSGACANCHKVNR